MAWISGCIWCLGIWKVKTLWKLLLGSIKSSNHFEQLLNVTKRSLPKQFWDDWFKNFGCLGWDFVALGAAGGYRVPKEN